MWYPIILGDYMNYTISKTQIVTALSEHHMLTIECVVRTFIIRLTHANVCESMGKPCSCMQCIKSRIFYCKSRKNLYQYYKSRENPYQVLQVTRTASERAMKSKDRMIKSSSP